MRTMKVEVSPDRPWFNPESGWTQGWAPSVEIPVISLGEALRLTAKAHPKARAMWFLGEEMNYQRLDELVDALAASLHNLGVRKGDVVSLLLPNSFQYVISYYACARLGAWASGINPTYKPAEALHQLKLTGARVLITLDALYEPVLAPIIRKSPVELLVHTNIADFLPWWKRTLGMKLGKIPFGPVPSHSQPFLELLKTTEHAPEVAIDPEKDVATLIMTGGTTGVPKAAMLTHFNCVANVYQAKDYLFKVAGDKAILGILPFFHSFGMTGVMNLSVIMGSWMMLFPKPPAMKELCETIDSVIKPGTDIIFLGAEVLFQKMADYLEAHPTAHNVKGKFSVCISGAGPLHKPVQDKFEQLTGCSLREGYGLSECTPLVSLMPLYGERSFGSIGIPFRGTDWKIMDIETVSRELPPGEENIGELVVHGPQMMLGYHRHLEDTEDCFMEFEGRRWLKTGDLGFMDHLGHVTLKDRKKQLIKYKGYSIFPNEIEQLLSGHPAVKEVAAYGIPDPEVNEVIKVWVVLEQASRGKVSEEDLRTWCRANLTHYKVPRYIEFIDELPKTAVGKVQRRQLAEADPLYQQGRTARA